MLPRMQSSFRHMNYIFVEFKDAIVAGALGGIAYALLIEFTAKGALITALSIAIGYYASNIMVYVQNSSAIMKYKSRYLMIPLFCLLAFILLYALVIAKNIEIFHIIFFYFITLMSIFITERFNLSGFVHKL